MAVTDVEIYNWINGYASGDAGPPATNSPIGSDTIGTDLDDQFRNLKSVVRKESINKAWERYRGLYGTLAYVSATQFTLTKASTDQTAIFAVGRRVRATITGSVLVGTITASTYGANVTTVTVVWDSGSLNNTLSEVEVGIFLPDQAAVPRARFQIAHNLEILGLVTPTTTIPHYIAVPSETIVTLKKAQHKVHGATSANVTLVKNGVGVAGYSGIVVTTSNATTSGDIALADGDLLGLVVNSISGTPSGLIFGLFLEIAATYDPST